MNIWQRILLFVAGLALGVMFLYPPWLFVLEVPSQSGRVVVETGHRYEERPAGYNLVFGQHMPEDITELNRIFSTKETSLQYFRLRLDKNRLAVQVAGVLLLVALFWLALRSPHRFPPQSKVVD